MPTLRENLDSLLDLQKIDSERDKTQRAIAHLNTGAAAQAAAQAAQGRLDEQRATASRSSGTLKDAELELAGLEKKLKSYEDRMRSGQITNPREVANTEREVNQLIRQRATLDDKILTLMDEGERLRTSVAEAEARAGEAEEGRRGQQAAARAQREGLETTLAGLNRQREQAAALVADAALLSRYEAIRKRPASAGQGIVRAEEGRCGGCHTQIGAQDAHHASEGSRLTLCESCGRILA